MILRCPLLLRVRRQFGSISDTAVLEATRLRKILQQNVTLQNQVYNYA